METIEISTVGDEILAKQGGFRRWWQPKIGISSSVSPLGSSTTTSADDIHAHRPMRGRCCSLGKVGDQLSSWWQMRDGR